MTVRNLLLLAAPASVRDEIIRDGEHFAVAVGDVIQEALHEPEHVYFPEDGVASVVAVMRDGSMVEGAIVGFEGFVGVPIALGAPRSTTRVIWQVPGSAHRFPAERFRALVQGGPLRDAVSAYINDMSDQTVQVAACNRRHQIIARAARWLLMTDDRVNTTSFTLTHEFLATMLGVNRPKVTLAAQRLQNAGLITYRRGVVTIIDRVGLEAAACECYAVLAATFPGHGPADPQAGRQS